jgi:hypothetical protein
VRVTQKVDHKHTVTSTNCNLQQGQLMCCSSCLCSNSWSAMACSTATRQPWQAARPVILLS